MDLTKIDVLAKLLNVNKRVDYIMKDEFLLFSGSKKKVLDFVFQRTLLIYGKRFNKKRNKFNFFQVKIVLKRDKLIKNWKMIMMFGSDFYS